MFNLVTGNIVSPLVYGKTVHLHPAVVLVAIPAGAAIGGILGMFLVVPFIGVVATIWRTVLEVIGMPRQPLGSSAGRSSVEGPPVEGPPAATSPPSGNPASVVPQPSEDG